MHIIIHGFKDRGWKNGAHVYSGDNLAEAHRAVAARVGEFQVFGRIYTPQFIPFTPQPPLVAQAAQPAVSPTSQPPLVAQAAQPAVSPTAQPAVSPTAQSAPSEPKKKSKA